MSYINKERLLNSFCDLAKIKSPSGQEEAIAQFVSDKLTTLGLFVQRDSYGNIIAKLTGRGEPLILCAHMDTVAVGAGEEIKPIRKDDAITSDGATILGADDKDAVAAILEVLQILYERKLPHRPLEIVFTREEEAISRGAQNLDLSLLSGKECIISDQAEAHGTIVLSAPYCFRFEIEVAGKRCHVKEPEKGINVVIVVAKAIGKMPLGRIDDFTTSNIAYQVSGLRGVIDQNDRLLVSLSSENRNTVPDLGLVYGEVRGSKIDKVRETLQKIESVFAEEALQLNGSALFTAKQLSSGYSFSEDDPLVAKAAAIFKQQGAQVKYQQAVGGSDANVLNDRGLHTLVVSSAHRNPHQCSEYLIIEDLVRLADFFLRLVT